MDASKYIGAPFAELGRDLATGVDCYGLLLLIMRERGVDLPDPEYKSDWAANGGNLFIENYADYATEVSEDDLVPGDVILLKGIEGVASHIAIYIGSGQFIHSSRGIGVTKGRLSSKQMRRRIVGFYQIKGAA